MSQSSTSTSTSNLTFTLTITVLSTILLTLLTVPTAAQSQTHLNITALTYQGNTSILQCWSIIPPFSTSLSGPVGASAVNLGAVSGNATFIVQGPGSVGGYKNAPGPQFSIFLSGLAHITLPYSPNPDPSETETWIFGGKYGVVYADDVYTDGHHTTFPSHEETVILGVPVGSGQPEHTIVREGGCQWDDLVGV